MLLRTHLQSNSESGKSLDIEEAAKVMAEEAEEMYENSYCRAHPGQSTVGICAICLQEKLGKLIFSEKQSLFPQQSEVGSSYSCSSSSSEAAKKVNGENHDFGSRKIMSLNDRSKNTGSAQGFVVLSRSKSVAVSRRVNGSGDSNPCHSNSHNKKKGSGYGSFWSFLSFSKKKTQSNGAVADKTEEEAATVPVAYNDFSSKADKVTRSRSVGCGSRSFSAAERFHPFVEKSPVGSSRKGAESHAKILDEEEEDGVKRSSSVRCGGLFVGFGGLPPSITSSSSCAMICEGVNGKTANGCHSRSRSWGWAFSSPIRAFRHSKRWNNSIKSNNEDSSASATVAAADAVSSPTASAMEIDRG